MKLVLYCTALIQFCVRSVAYDQLNELETLLNEIAEVNDRIENDLVAFGHDDRMGKTVIEEVGKEKFWKLTLAAAFTSKKADSFSHKDIFDPKKDREWNKSTYVITEPKEDINEGMNKDYFYAWYDGKDDASIVTMIEGRCYVGFRSSQGRNDWIGNLLWLTWSRMRQQPQCTTSDLYKAGWETPYEPDLTSKVKDCVENKCTHEKDDCLVITGYSQGAAIAMVATVALKEYNPWTFVFAHPQSLHGNCKRFINEERVFRFYNTIQRGHHLYYDIIATGATSMNGRDFGHKYLLPPKKGDLFIKDGGYAKGKSEGGPYHASAHFFGNVKNKNDGYMMKIESLQKDWQKINYDGFPKGTVCADGSTCASGKCKMKRWHHWSWNGRNKKCE